jgi:hypothetical protein
MSTENETGEFNAGKCVRGCCAYVWCPGAVPAVSLSAAAVSVCANSLSAAAAPRVMELRSLYKWPGSMPPKGSQRFDLLQPNHAANIRAAELLAEITWTHYLAELTVEERRMLDGGEGYLECNGAVSLYASREQHRLDPVGIEPVAELVHHFAG